jgi:quinol monooxygenase YgiN
MLYVYAKMHPRADSLHEFESVAIELAKRTRTEPGCVSFELVKAESGGLYALTEKFQDKEALDIHLNMDHYKKLFPKLSALLEQPIEVMFHQTVF